MLKISTKVIKNQAGEGYNMVKIAIKFQNVVKPVQNSTSD